MVHNDDSLKREDALDDWPNNHDTFEAIREALNEMATDEGVLLEDFDRSFRKRHGLPAL